MKPRHGQAVGIGRAGMPTACPWEPHVCRYTRRHPLLFLSAGQRRLRRCPAGRVYDCLADVAANVTIPRASRGHLGAGRAGAGVANVEPRNEGPGNPQRPTSVPARVVSFPCPSFPCPSVRIGRLPIITALPKHGVPPSLCLPDCVQAAQHHPVALEKSRMFWLRTVPDCGQAANAHSRARRRRSCG